MLAPNFLFAPSVERMRCSFPIDHARFSTLPLSADLARAQTEAEQEQRPVAAFQRATGERGTRVNRETSEHPLIRSLLKGSVLYLAALSYFVIGIVHPIELNIGDDPDLYIVIHVVQLFSIWGIALGLWFLTEGIENRAATIARAAILPYAVFYSAFDAIAGIATGLVVLESNGMSLADQETMKRFMDGLMDTAFGYALYFGSGLTWLVAAGAAGLALKGQVHGGAIALMVVGAAIFAVGHPFPPGPVGISLFAAGLTWFHIARTHARPAIASTRSLSESAA
jgi:hypothetical protein